MSAMCPVQLLFTYTEEVPSERQHCNFKVVFYSSSILATLKTSTACLSSSRTNSHHSTSIWPGYLGWYSLAIAIGDTFTFAPFSETSTRHIRIFG